MRGAWRTIPTVGVGLVAALAIGCGPESDAAETAMDEGPAETAEFETAEEPMTTPYVDRFATLDADGDSYLDADEIAEWVDDEGIFTRWDIDRDSELDENEIAGNAFSLWDANGDGFLTESEWRSGTELWYPDAYELRTYGDWDLDADSELDADEFAESFDAPPLGEYWVEDGMNEETFKTAYFELYDLNDDGRVDQDEWTAGSAIHGAPIGS